ncbi:MAG: glycosyltransferase family 4 protein, partial [Syntrophothermus sp.]
ILTKKKKVKDCLFITSHVFNRIRKIAEKAVVGKDILFTFQTQSLFDASISGIPHFVYTDHTFLENQRYPDFSSSKMPSEKWLKMEMAVYHNAAVNFTMSSNISSSLINDYGIDKSRIFNAGAGSNLLFHPIMKRKRNYSGRNVLFVGARWERKGGPMLIEAFLKVIKTFPDAKLTIIGSSPVINHPNIKVMGKLPLDEVMKYYADASIFCLPTRLEPFGIVFIEAMMFSLPVIATGIGAIPDLITDGENGIIIKSDDQEHLTAALSEMLSDPEKCRKYGEAGYLKYSNGYTWEKVGQKMSERIKSVLSAAPDRINALRPAHSVSSAQKIK